MKRIKFGFALASLALFGASSLFANKITLTNNADSSSNEYESIQKALDAIPAEGGDYTISLEPGTYEEVLYYKGPASIKLSGQSKEKYGADVVISEANDGDLWKQKRSASAQNGRCIFEFEGTGDLFLENLTMENTFKRGSVKGSNTQAETIGFDSTGKLAAYNCAFKSHQDTLRMTGKSWFYKCYIEGDTDFIWMEARGVVALFEECEIRALYDEKPSTPAIIGAPRMNIQTRIGKGLVIYNSKVSSEVPKKTFLARTPWNAGYYNQVAYINTAIPDVDPNLWQAEPLTAEGVARTTLGWKLDKNSLAYVQSALSGSEKKTETISIADYKSFNFGNRKDWYFDPLFTGYEFAASSSSSSSSASSGRSDVLSAKEVSEEFGGRRAILNRYFNYARNDYRKDYEDNWKIDDFIKKNGWKVSADNSKELVSEKEAVVTVYDFSKDLSSYSDLTVDGFYKSETAASDVPVIVGEPGNTISFTVPEKASVTVYGLYKGKGSIQAANQGVAFFNFNNGSKTVEKEKEYLVYENGGKVTIKADETTYISRIVVETDSKLKFVPVTKITVSPKDNVTEVASKKKLQFFASLTPVLATNTDYVWSVSDESVATISEFGVLKTKAAPEDTVITVKATSKDSKGVSGEYKIKVLKVDPKAFTISWLHSEEASKAPFAGESDNEDVVASTNARPAGKESMWVNNTSKYNSSFSDGGVTYTGFSKPIVGKDTVYIDFPITAKQDLDLETLFVSYGNHGTGNIAASVAIVRGKEVEELFADTSKKARSAKKSYPIGEEVKAGETVIIRVALYGYANDDTEIAVGKAPTIGTIQISGSAQ